MGERVKSVENNFYPKVIRRLCRDHTWKKHQPKLSEKMKSPLTY